MAQLKNLIVNGVARIVGKVFATEFVGNLSWTNITDKPSSYTPSSHTHSYLPLSGGSVTGDLAVNGQLKLGSSSSSNCLSFYGLSGDAPGSYNHTYIGERIWGGTEDSELLLFKGNDIGDGVSGTTHYASGPDRIRHIAASHVFQTYTSALSGSFEAIATSSLLETKFDISKNQINAYIPIVSSSTITASSFVGNATSSTSSTNSTNVSGGSVSGYVNAAPLYIGSGGAGGRLNNGATNGGCNSILIGDDVWLGDVNVGGVMGMKSTTSQAGFYFLNSGGTNIGTLLQTSGTLTSNSTINATAFKATSDINKKENIEKIPNYDLSSVSTYKYNFKDDESKETRIGLIAQEVQQVIPDAVSSNVDNSALTLDYNAITAVLVSVVNDQQKQINILKDELARIRPSSSNEPIH